MRVCVVGGGNIAHAVAAKLSQVMPVTVVTRRPVAWSSRLIYRQGGVDCESRCEVNATSDVTILSNADSVFIALPQSAIEETLDRIGGCLKVGSTIVFVPGPTWISRYAERLASCGIRTVGFQRVPYISRIMEYGRSVIVSEDRQVHKIAISDLSMKDEWSERCSVLFGGRVEYLSSFLTMAFSNSNPLLHPSRLVVLFDDWRRKIYSYNPPFYGEWTDESSELYVNADHEMCETMTRYPIDMKADYESVFDHYGVRTVSELTYKLRTIPSFKTILSPMIRTVDGWRPDFDSRYFTEDVQFGLVEMLKLADRVGVPVPTMRALYEGVKKMG